MWVNQNSTLVYSFFKLCFTHFLDYSLVTSSSFLTFWIPVYPLKVEVQFSHFLILVSDLFRFWFTPPSSISDTTHIHHYFTVGNSLEIYCKNTHHKVNSTFNCTFVKEFLQIHSSYISLFVSQNTIKIPAKLSKVTSNLLPVRSSYACNQSWYTRKLWLITNNLFGEVIFCVSCMTVCHWAGEAHVSNVQCCFRYCLFLGHSINLNLTMTCVCYRQRQVRKLQGNTMTVLIRNISSITIKDAHLVIPSLELQLRI